jgi:bisphosphoglycerate-independent phosphoglycerate mutase (AlkP superfamily)
VLAKRISAKYKNYQWDRDTKEIDIEMDYEAAWYLQLIRKHPDMMEQYQDEYNTKTDKSVKMLNRRKRAMAKIEKGSEVKLINGEAGEVAGFTRRGFPIVQIGNDKRPIFYEECRLS